VFVVLSPRTTKAAAKPVEGANRQR
jgi:hypothetical protein